MGLNFSIYKFGISVFGSKWSYLVGKKIVELGSYNIRPPVANILNTKLFKSRHYFNSIGADCVSLDIAGHKGSIPIDLREKITDDNLLNCFDVLTNFGTSEHVYPPETQKNCFLNCHILVKPGGYMFHAVPFPGYYRKHCKIRYKTSFFSNLATKNNYKIVKLKLIKINIKTALTMCILKKINDNQFCDSDFFSGIVIDRNIKK